MRENKSSQKSNTEKLHDLDHKLKLKEQEETLVKHSLQELQDQNLFI